MSKEEKNKKGVSHAPYIRDYFYHYFSGGGIYMADSGRGVCQI